MKNKILIYLILIMIFLSSCGKRTNIFINESILTNESNEKLVYYIGKVKKNEYSKKLIIIIQGSGKHSVTNKFGYGSYFSMLGYDTLFMEKYAFNNEELFNNSNKLTRRINDITLIINDVTKRIYSETLEKIIIIADSEGGSIAPEISLKFDKVSGLLILGAGGLPQKNEFEILLDKELNHKRGKLFSSNGIFNKNQLNEKFKEIKENNTSKLFWLGHSYMYWNDALFYNPEKYIKELKIPTMYIIGTEDDNVPVESVKNLENKYKNKDNIRFEVINELNHNFMDKNGRLMLEQLAKEKIIPWIESI